MTDIKKPPSGAADKGASMKNGKPRQNERAESLESVAVKVAQLIAMLNVTIADVPAVLHMAGDLISQSTTATLTTEGLFKNRSEY